MKRTAEELRNAARAALADAQDLAWERPEAAKAAKARYRRAVAALAKLERLSLVEAEWSI